MLDCCCCFCDVVVYKKIAGTLPPNMSKQNHWQYFGAPEFWCPGTRTLMPFQVDNWFFIVISRMDIRNINLSFSQVYWCVPDISWFFQNIASTNVSTPSRNPPKKWGGTRVLVPGHQNSGALSSWKQVFCFNLKNGLQDYQFLFFPKCIYVFRTFPGLIGTLPA